MGTYGEGVNRPRPPALADIRHHEDASPEQRLAVIDWAIQWTDETRFQAADLLPLLDALIDGAATPRNDPAAARILTASYSLIARERDLNNSRRLHRAFPYTMLIIGPERTDGCDPAREQNGKLQSWDCATHLPLEGCNAARCVCSWRTVTRREAEKE